MQKWESSKTNGSKGGRPRKTQSKPNTKPNQNPTTNPTETITVHNSIEDNIIIRGFNHLSINKTDYDKLLISYTEEQIEGVLDSIQNYKKNTSYTSLYLTANKWLKKEYPLQSKTTSSKKYTDEFLRSAKVMWEMDKIIKIGLAKEDEHLITG